MTVFEALPTGLRGLFVAGLIAAVMSTLSSYILVQAAACTKDLYTAFTGKSVSDEKMIKWSNVATVIIIIFSMLATSQWMSGIVNAIYFVTGFQVAGLFVPLVVGLFYKKRTPQAGWITMAFGFAFWLFWNYIMAESTGVPANNITWVASFILYMIICKITYKGAGGRTAGLQQGV